ncbi:MAG TPA: hypothetical protein VEW64_00880 [Methyloceanibacter sp.]|jgi:hypothetical protein|nr:hypothetical protein [Methyloceanibacter sp.]
MPRTVLHYTLVALAAVALVSAFAIGTVSAADTPNKSNVKTKAPTISQKTSPKPKKKIDPGPVDYQFRGTVPY